MDGTNSNSAADNKVGSVGATGTAGSRQKEQTPISSKVESEISEIIEASEKAPMISTEVREAGVEQVSDKLTLTDEHKAVGMENAGESTPVHTQPLGMVKLPMSEKEALKTLKTTSNTDSRHWLAVLIERVYKKIHFLVKSSK